MADVRTPQDGDRNPYRNKLEDHTRAILKDVDILAKFGTPGFVMAYGSKVYPQVISTEQNILICAAEYNSGRIVVATHSNYANGLHNASVPTLQTFQKNVLGWLSKGNITDKSQYRNHLLEITDDASVSQINSDTKVIFWAHNNNSLSATSESAIDEFVQNGGGLFYAFTPWAYLVYAKPVIPLHSLFRKIGMTFSDDYDVLYGSDDGFTIDLNDAHFTTATNNNLHEYSKKEEEFLQSDLLLRQQKYLMTMISHKDDFRTQILQLYNSNYSLFQIPTKDNPVKTNTAKSMLVMSDVLARYGIPGMEVSPGAGHFPGIAVGPAEEGHGSVLGQPQDESGKMQSSGKIVELEMISFTKDIFPTGCYANPGQHIKVEIMSGSGKGWKINIGAHTDFLNPQHQSELRRFFDVHVVKEMREEGITELVSPYGGVIQFESADKEEGKCALKIKLWNVLMTPYFDMKDDLCKIKWSETRSYPGVWADISGEYFMVTLPRKSVEGIVDPSPVMAKWDRIIRLMHHLRGTDVRTHRKQWLVTDEQPSAGYLHMGYPVVSHLDIADPTNDSFVLSGNWSNFWGIYHEIGHNLQRDAWTFEGALEVTCNIFSMYCMYHVTGDSPMKCEWVQLQMPGIRNALVSGDYNFASWKSDPGIAIGIYAQLCEHLGWDCMCHVLRHYEALTAKEPLSDQEKINHWFVAYSNAAQVNLAPLFDFWEWPLSESSKQEVEQNNYPKWLPDDEITKMDQSRVRSIQGIYPNMERSVTQREFPFVFESKTTMMSVV